MKSKAVLFGHPIHPMLIPFPIGLLAGGVVADVIGWLRSDASWSLTAERALAAGIVMAVVAAVPGVIDYFETVPPHSSAKTRATRHMAVNLTAVAMFAGVWLFRPAGPVSVPLVLLELAAFALLGGGGYLGGTLVTRNLISVDHRHARAGKWREAELDGIGSGGPVVAARRDELAVDQMKLLRIGERRIVLARTDGGYAAFDDRCTHRGGSLTGGVLICGTVQCLWHGSQFDTATGAVKAGPATDAIRTYKVDTEGDHVRVYL